MDFECEDIKSLEDLIDGLKSGFYEKLLRVTVPEFMPDYSDETQFEYEINEKKDEVVITTQWKGSTQFQTFSAIFQRKEVFIVQEDTLIVKANLKSVGHFVPSVLRHCAFLKNLRFEGGFEYIRYYAFSNFRFLTSVELNEDLKKIEDFTFEYCSNLREVKFPKNLHSIGDYALKGCSSLEKVEVTGDSISIGESCFADCDALGLIKVPTDLTFDSFESVHCELPKQVKLVFYGTGLTMTDKERKSLLEKAKSLEEKPETVYEVLRLLYPEEFVVKDFESDKVAGEVEETSLF